jgi:hypothetical protein
VLLQIVAEPHRMLNTFEPSMATQLYDRRATQ